MADPVADPGLVRFHQAQAPVYERVVSELASGRKTSHWMWYIFPQLTGLGQSQTALAYGLCAAQAQRYLADPVLGRRLRECVGLVLQHRDRTARAIFGSPDDLKFRSSLTLFAALASDPSDRSLFLTALDEFYDAVPDPLTLDQLEPACAARLASHSDEGK